MSEFENDILIGTYTDATVRHMHMGNPPFYNVVDSATTIFAGEFSGIVDLMQAADGCILALDGGFTNNGRLVKICPDNSSVEQLNSLEVSIYPNPAKNQLNIMVSPNDELDLVILYDMAGRVVLNTKVSTIDLSDLKNGMYVLRVIDSLGNSASKPFTISR